MTEIELKQANEEYEAVYAWASAEQKKRLLRSIKTLRDLMAHRYPSAGRSTGKPVKKSERYKLNTAS